MTYRIVVAYLNEKGEASVITYQKYHAETAWQAVMNIMCKRDVCTIRGSNLLRIDVVDENKEKVT